MKKVLVIGANSYISQRLNEYILQKYRSEIFIDLVNAKDGSWRQKDFKNYNVVLHLAALVHLKEKDDMESFYYEINHKLTVEVAEKAKRSMIKHFIFMSTEAVYGQRTGCITKETKPVPITYYGKSKLAAEKDIMKLQDKNFIITVVRSPMVYGDKCNGNYARLVKLAKFTPFFPEYHNKRSMIHIDNLTKFLANLIFNESSGGYFHPQDEEYVDTCELFKKIRKSMGKKTILFSCLNGLIRFLIEKDISVFQKIFGDLIYDKSLV